MLFRVINGIRINADGSVVKKGETFESDLPEHKMFVNKYRPVAAEEAEEAGSVQPDLCDQFDNLPEGWKVVQTEKGWYAVIDENGEKLNDKRLRLGKVQAFLDELED